MYIFVRQFYSPLSVMNFRNALELARRVIKSHSGYRKGMFFKLLLLGFDKDIGWKDAERIEDMFLQRLT